MVDTDLATDARKVGWDSSMLYVTLGRCASSTTQHLSTASVLIHESTPSCKHTYILIPSSHLSMNEIKFLIHSSMHSFISAPVLHSFLSPSSLPPQGGHEAGLGPHMRAQPERTSGAWCTVSADVTLRSATTKCLGMLQRVDEAHCAGLLFNSIP